MNREQIYCWIVTISQQFSQLGKWQAMTLALFSLGVVFG